MEQHPDDAEAIGRAVVVLAKAERQEPLGVRGDDLERIRDDPPISPQYGSRFADRVGHDLAECVPPQFYYTREDLTALRELAAEPTVGDHEPARCATVLRRWHRRRAPDWLRGWLSCVTSRTFSFSAVRLGFGTCRTCGSGSAPYWMIWSME